MVTNTGNPDELSIDVAWFYRQTDRSVIFASGINIFEPLLSVCFQFVWLPLLSLLQCVVTISAFIISTHSYNISCFWQEIHILENCSFCNYLVFHCIIIKVWKWCAVDALVSLHVFYSDIIVILSGYPVDVLHITAISSRRENGG